MAHSYFFSEIKNHGGNGMATRKIINGIVYEKHGECLFYPVFADCQQTELTLWGHRAVELMEETDPSTLDIINISGLGKTIWTEISNSVEQAYKREYERLMSRSSPEEQLSREYEYRGFAQRIAWEHLRTCVMWLAAAVRECGSVAETAKLTLFCE